MPLLEKRQVLAAAVEATPGTAEALGAGDAFAVIDPVLRPDIDMAPRKWEGSFDGRPSIAIARRGRCTFGLEMAGDGSGGVPSWAPVFLPACTLARTGAATKIFRRLIGPPKTSTTDNRTITLGLFMDGVYEQIHGAMGSVNFVFAIGMIVRAWFDFTGVYTSNVDTAVVELTPSTVAPLPFAASNTVITPETYVGINIDVKNKTEMIRDRSAGGLKHAVVKGGEIGGRLRIQSGTTTTKVRRDFMLAHTVLALKARVGDVGNNRVQWWCNQMQVVGLESEADGILYDDMPFRASSRTAGDRNGALRVTFS